MRDELGRPVPSGTRGEIWFKVPTTIAVWADPLPRNPAGKVLKRELRDLVVGAAADVGS